MPLIKKVILIGILGQLSLIFFQSLSMGAITVPVEPRDRVDVSINVDVQFDEAAQLYTYHYQVTNLSTSQQEVSDFAVEVDGELMNIQSPEGWSPFIFSKEPVILWGAIGSGDGPSDPPPGGGDVPSPFQIKPGETLGGFSFQSPAAPTVSKFFTQGWVQIPRADDAGDFDDAGVVPLPFTQDSKSGSILSPGLDDSLIFNGGRRPSVDGFLAFVGNENRETRTLPIAIIIRFGINGETVFPETFSAALNRVDVTQDFIMTGNGDERVAFFEVGSSPIVVGRNVLVTGLDGIVPGTTRTATDGDAFTFFAVE